MEISFTSKKLQKLCNSAAKLRGAYGAACAGKIQRRLSEMEAAECLEDLRRLPQARCHDLRADRKGQLAVDVEHPKRLIFKPGHDPRPTRPNGSLDWSQVTRVVIVEIDDYH